jgi:hypothetical protein
MRPESQIWLRRFLDEERLAIIEAAPSPLPDAIDLASAISLAGLISLIRTVELHQTLLA